MIAEELWTYAGLRLGKSGKLLAAWHGPDGVLLAFKAGRESAIGATYRVKVERGEVVPGEDPGIILHGRPVFVKAGESSPEWVLADREARALKDATAREKRIAARELGACSLDNVRAQLAKSRGGARTALLASVLSFLTSGRGVVLALLFLAAPALADCGTERWAVKTGQDGRLKLAPPVAVTVETMRSWPAPVRPGARVAPHEATIYAEDARLFAYKVEADEDIHLVLGSAAASPTGPVTMIAEIPNEECMAGAPADLVLAVRAARAAFLASFKLGGVGKLKHLAAPVLVHVEGAGYFDKLHGQAGLAPNGIELHPLTLFRVAK